MRRLTLPLALIIILAFTLSACVMVKAKPAPPGQVQKATGYNPASGKHKNK